MLALCTFAIGIPNPLMPEPSSSLDVHAKQFPAKFPTEPAITGTPWHQTDGHRKGGTYAIPRSVINSNECCVLLTNGWTSHSNTPNGQANYGSQVAEPICVTLEQRYTCRCTSLDQDRCKDRGLRTNAMAAFTKYDAAKNKYFVADGTAVNSIIMPYPTNCGWVKIMDDDKDKSIDNRVFKAGSTVIGLLGNDLDRDVLGTCVGWAGVPTDAPGNIGERP